MPGHRGGSAAALLELDWDSNVVWSYRNELLHHDFVRLPNGNTLVLIWRRFSPELTTRVQSGYRTDVDPEKMFGDVMQEISPEGAVVWEWRAWEHLDVNEDIICPLESREEWTHCDSLALTPHGNLLVSFRKTEGESRTHTGLSQRFLRPSPTQGRRAADLCHSPLHRVLNPETATRAGGRWNAGRGTGTRTQDLHDPSVARYRAALCPEM